MSGGVETKLNQPSSVSLCFVYVKTLMRHDGDEEKSWNMFSNII